MLQALDFVSMQILPSLVVEDAKVGTCSNLFPSVPDHFPKQLFVCFREKGQKWHAVQGCNTELYHIFILSCPNASIVSSSSNPLSI